jgi:hypothetical protein
VSRLSRSFLYRLAYLIYRIYRSNPAPGLPRNGVGYGRRPPKLLQQGSKKTRAQYAEESRKLNTLSDAVLPGGIYKFCAPRKARRWLRFPGDGGSSRPTKPGPSVPHQATRRRQAPEVEAGCCPRGMSIASPEVKPALSMVQLVQKNHRSVGKIPAAPVSGGIRPAWLACSFEKCPQRCCRNPKGRALPNQGHTYSGIDCCRRSHSRWKLH